MKRNVFIPYWLVVIFGIIVMVLSGLWATQWRSRQTDERIREGMLIQAIEIARTINPEMVKNLSFTEKDLESPIYHQIREQLMAYGYLIPQRGIYTMVLRDGKILFGPENYKEGDPMGEGPPGTVYEEPGEEDFEIFTTGKPIVLGPIEDEYGKFISAMAPVFDPVTGQVIMVLGIDILTENWEQAIANSRKLPVVLLCLLLFTIIMGYLLIWHRKRMEIHVASRYTHVETIITATICTLLTLASSLLVFESEQKERAIIFNQQASISAEYIREIHQRIHQDMEAVARYFQTSNDVDSLEFIDFTSPMVNTPFLASLIWAPFESDGRLIVRFAAPGFPENYYPGYDLASDQTLRPIILHAYKTGLVSGSDPFLAVSDSSDKATLIVLKPVFSEGFTTMGKAQKPVMGLIFATIDLENLVENLNKISGLKRDLIATELIDIRDDTSIYCIVKNSQNPLQRIGKINPDDDFTKFQFSKITPLFIFGKTFAVVTHTTPTFIRTYPIISAWITGILGLLITIILTYVIGNHRTREYKLGEAVLQRTMELHERVKELEVAKEKAEAGNRLKTAFIQNISHEVRTPLNGILGFGSLIIQEGIREPERVHYYGILKQNSDRLLKTITNIMDLSSIQSGNMEVKQTWFDLCEVMYLLRDQFHPVCEIKGIGCNLKIPDHTKKRFILSDRELVIKTMSHLLDNAVKFTLTGEINFGYTVSKHEIRIFIHDTGIGISQESQSRVLENFVQEELLHTRGYEGSGLGLSLANSMIQLLGGKLEIQSEKGVGSMLSFFLPYQEDDRLTDKNPTPGYSFNNSRIILVAEDDDANLEYIKALLSAAGYILYTASNGKKALELCVDHPEISLVLMDVKMPVMDGLEATGLIKSKRKNLPVIAITSYALKGDRQMAMNAGCDDYIGKPFTREQLMNMIGKYIGQID